MKTTMKIMLTAGILTCSGLLMTAPTSYAATKQSAKTTTTAMHKVVAKKMHTSKIAVSTELKQIQKELIKHGAKIKADGIMGKHTRAAIRTFQKKSKLKVTGKLDKETLAKLK